MDSRRLFSLFKLLQLVFGLVVYFMYMSYNVNGAIVSGADSSNEAFVRSSFGMTTVTAFPFIIIALTVIVYFINNQSIDNNLLHFLFSIVGFAMYLISGALVLNHCGDYSFCSDGKKATGVVLLATSVVYLVEVVFGAMERCR